MAQSFAKMDCLRHASIFSNAMQWEDHDMANDPPKQR